MKHVGSSVSIKGTQGSAYIDNNRAEFMAGFSPCLLYSFERVSKDINLGMEFRMHMLLVHSFFLRGIVCLNGHERARETNIRKMKEKAL